MTATVISSVVVDIKTRGSKTLKNDVSKASKEVTKLKKSTKEAGSESKKFGISAKVGFTAAAVAAGAAFVEINQMISTLVIARREMETLAGISGTTADELIILGRAGREFGLSAEQIGDQMKDLQDKLGDFVATGAGPLKDVFEVLGEETRLTAEGLAAMSGPQAMGALVAEAERLNIPLAQQVFLWESLGNDVSKTAKIYADNNKVLNETIDTAAKLNLIIGQESVKALDDANKSWENLGDITGAIGTDLLAAIAPAFEFVNKEITDFLALARRMGSDDFTLADVSAIKSLTELEVALKQVTIQYDIARGKARRFDQGEFLEGFFEGNESYASLLSDQEDILKALQALRGELEKPVKATSGPQPIPSEVTQSYEDAVSSLLAYKREFQDFNSTSIGANDANFEGTLRLIEERNALQKEGIILTTDQLELYKMGGLAATNMLTGVEAMKSSEEDLANIILARIDYEHQLVAIKKEVGVATAAQKKQEQELAAQQESGLRTLSQGMTSFLLEGKEGLANFAKQLTATIIQAQILRVLTATVPGLGGALGAVTASADGNAFNGGALTAFANGGVVSNPTVFPMADGAGLMGEAGPEGILPLKRGKGGKLGVISNGGSGGGGGITNNIVINDAKDPTETGNQVQMGVERAMRNSVAQTMDSEKRYGGTLNPRNVIRSF